MTEHLTEAAGIYLKEYAVLESARNELSTYLDPIWSVAKREAEGQFPDSAETLSEWAERTNPGRWHLNVRDSKLGVEVIVSDPRRAEAHNAYELWLWVTSEAFHQELKRDARLQDRLTRAVGEDAVLGSLDWSQRKLASSTIPFAGGSQADAAASIMEALASYMSALLAMRDTYPTPASDSK